MHGSANPHGSRGSGRAEWALAAVQTGPERPFSARQGPEKVPKGPESALTGGKFSFRGCFRSFVSSVFKDQSPLLAV